MERLYRLALFLLLAPAYAATTGTGTYGSGGYIDVPNALTAGGRLEHPIYLGTAAAAGNLNLNSLRSYYAATNSGSTFTLTLATNTTIYSATNIYIRVDINNTSGSTATWSLSGFGTVVTHGNVYTNQTGWNTIEIYSIGGTVHVSQDTAKLDFSQMVGTLDPSANGVTWKMTDRMPFVGPWRVDGTGCTVGTTNTASYNGKAIFSSSSSTNANYALYHPDAFVPTDLDSSVAMTLKLAIAIGSTDTTSETFTVGYYQPASGSVFAPSDYTALSGYISFTTGTLTSAAANKIYYVTVTLTGWAAALTPDRELWIGIARAGTANANQIFVVGGCLTYGRTQ